MSTDQQLKQWVDYRRQAVNGATLAGQLDLARVPRTRDVVVADSGAAIDVTVHLTEDAQRRVMLTGRVHTVLTLACQRCLEPTEQPMAIDVAGIVVASDAQAAEVPHEWEPMLAQEEQLDLHALIDDELLLALPMSVKCDRPSCQAAYDREPAVPDDESRAHDKPNPFAVLASLKRDDNQSQ